MPHWGYHFPTLVDGDGRPTRHLHWGGENAGLHFTEDMTGVPSTPAGAGAFEIVLDTEATVIYAWGTGVAKHRSGLEQRANNVDDPAVRYEAQALLLGGDVRAVRSRIARSASAGLPFLIGIPWEAAPVVASSTGTTITVPSTAALDWAEPGVRVLVKHDAYGAVSTVIQSVTSTTIEVLDTLGDVGRIGGLVMPFVAVLLDAQQGFERYQPRDPVERWRITARNADGGWRRAAVPNRLDLAGELAGIAVESRLAADVDVFFLIDDTGTGTGAVAETNVSATEWHVAIRMEPGVTTVADVIALLGSSTVVRPAGTTTNGSATVGTPEEIVGLLAGGSGPTAVEAGKTATLTTYRDRPVWDRGIVIDNTVNDSVQTMSIIIDLGGLPSSSQTASIPDWGRAVNAVGNIGAEWQWAKKMLWTLGGRWGSFWLSTCRDDLTWLSTGAGTLKVANGDGDGDPWGWYPAHRRDLAILTTDGSVAYARIASAANNFDGTVTLSIVDEDDAPLTIVGAVKSISWLERVRLESDEVAVTFRSMHFMLSIQARTAHQGDA